MDVVTCPLPPSVYNGDSANVSSDSVHGNNYYCCSVSGIDYDVGVHHSGNRLLHSTHYC